MGYSGKLIIFTTFYKQQALSCYCDSLFQTAVLLERLGIKNDYWSNRGDFHVERSVNKALTAFLNSDATDLIIIDSDEEWRSQDIVRLLMHEEEIVSGSYRTITPAIRYLGELKTAEDRAYLGRLLPDGNALLEAHRIPGGFLRIKKSAIKKYVDAYPDDYFFQEVDGKEEKVYPFFWNEIKDHIFYGMDYALSEKWTAIGLKLWIDPMIEISHWGLTEYKGNLDKYLRVKKDLQEGEGAFSTVAQMAKEIEERNG
ncbi:MAG: hypothetical protein WC476_12680 [Phycisphaerae bacterium]|jgi:hypothetical protein